MTRLAAKSKRLVGVKHVQGPYFTVSFGTEKNHRKMKIGWGIEVFPPQYVL